MRRYLNIWFVLSVVLAGMLMGGCGSTSSSVDPDVPSYKINIENGQTGVPTDLAKITIQFERQIDLGTVDGSKIFVVEGAIQSSLSKSNGYSSLCNPNNAVGATLSCESGLLCNLTPDQLKGLTTYTLCLSGLVYLDGTPFVDKSIQFTTAEGGGTTIIEVNEVSPSNGAVSVAVNSNISAQFKNAIDPSTITADTFIIINSSDGAVVDGTRLYNSNLKAVIFTSKEDLNENTKYTATLTTGIKDLSGGALNSAYSWSFTTISAGPSPIDYPVVEMVFPDENSTDVAVDVEITAKFNKNMNAGTINEDTFIVSSAGGAVSAAIIDYNEIDRTAKFTPSDNLSNGTLYTVKISNDVADTDGNGLEEDYEWTFTTVAAPGVPNVIAHFPIGDSVSVYTAVTATFDLDMDELTIDEDSFLVQNGGSVSGEISYNSLTRVATFAPLIPLTSGTTYNVTITTAVASEAGVHLPSDFTWQFTTVSPVGGWTSIAGGGVAPTARTSHAAVWTESEMVVWGGLFGGNVLNTGARFDPVSASWSSMSVANAPSARYDHSAVFAGSVVNFWGGREDFWTYLNDGGRYDPLTDSWAEISLVNAPAGRVYHSAVSTEDQMIIWGGTTSNWQDYKTGGKYNPGTDEWVPTSTTVGDQSPEARYLHTAVWTGSEMIVWGGASTQYLNTGSRYDPLLNSWNTITTVGAPTGRIDHSAVWSGSLMVIWGGYDGANSVNTGGKYNPVTDSWSSTVTDGSPLGRDSHTVVYIGSNKMIVWGGWDTFGNFLNTGGVYEMSAGGDVWSSTTTTNAPSARYGHSAVWSGSKMIVWGGWTGAAYTSSGGRYNPSDDSWESTSATTVVERARHAAVWAGTEMIVWGGQNSGAYLNSGGRYDPVNDTWQDTSTDGAPTGRSYIGKVGVWTGTEMIVWGGFNGSYLNTGGRYSPSGNSWQSTSTTNVPIARREHTAVWTGSKMVVWGGYNGFVENTGGRYDPSNDSWLSTTTANNNLTGRSRHSTVWTGGVMIVCGGYISGSSSLLNTCDRYNPVTNRWGRVADMNIAARAKHTAVWDDADDRMLIWGGDISDWATTNTGAVYDLGTDKWTSTSTGDNVPSARNEHCSIWTGSRMVIWGGWDINYTNTGGLYNPDADSWIILSTISAPTARTGHKCVWTGEQMVVWGGTDFAGELDSGGRYYPETNVWQSMPVPLTARSYHSTVWTGSHMIVWGGYNSTGYLGSGSKYDPSTNSWTAISSTDAPSARRYHSSVWTGEVMIIWGGDDGGGYMNTGGRYNPAADSWSVVTTLGAPSARRRHSAVWTGTQMIIYGGNTSGAYAGGKYDPASNNWQAVSTTGEPPERYYHSAVWTGSKMIVWGGCRDSTCEWKDREGGIYDPVEDIWESTSTLGAPSGRRYHSAVWTGTKMIIWGGDGGPYGGPPYDTGGMYDPDDDVWGSMNLRDAPLPRTRHSTIWTGLNMMIWGGYYDEDLYYNTGSIYDPADDSWIDMKTDDAPVARMGHSAIWTDDEMIVWGGQDMGGTYLSSGGRYTP